MGRDAVVEDRQVAGAQHRRAACGVAGLTELAQRRLCARSQWGGRDRGHPHVSGTLRRSAIALWMITAACSAACGSVSVVVRTRK
jgi:hypothetical protein